MWLPINCNGLGRPLYIYYFPRVFATREHPAGAFGAVGLDSVLLQKYKNYTKSLSFLVQTPPKNKEKKPIFWNIQHICVINR